MQKLQKAVIPILGCGFRLRGQKSVYSICGQFRANNHDVWPAFDLQRKPVVIKRAPPDRLRNEIETLQVCGKSPHIRQLLDVSDEPPSMVLERLDTSLYAASLQQKLERHDIKQTVKAALRGLAVLHGHGRIHNDIKPDNILANRGHGVCRFSEIKIADLGDSSTQNASANGLLSVSGTAVYRAPEMILRAPWTTAVDIWALGATALFFMVGDHFFAPQLSDPGHDLVHDKILRRQMRCFGPFPEHFIDIVPDVYKEYYLELESSTGTYPNRWPGPLASFLSPEEEEFVRLLLKPDPRDRPTAEQAIGHPWLKEVP